MMLVQPSSFVYKKKIICYECLFQASKYQVHSMIKKEAGALKSYARSRVKFFLPHYRNMGILVRVGRKDLTA